MTQESHVNKTSEFNEMTLSFVKNLCARIAQALENVSVDSEKETSPIPQISLAKSEGIGLFVYIRENQSEIKNKFPQQTGNLIVNILLNQWQKLNELQKLNYCSKIDSRVFDKSKKLKKIGKMAQKLIESLTTPDKFVQIEQDLEEPQNVQFGTQAKSAQHANAGELQEEDTLPKKKNPNADPAPAQILTEPLDNKEAGEKKVNSQQVNIPHCSENPEDQNAMDIQQPILLSQKTSIEPPNVPLNDLTSPIQSSNQKNVKEDIKPNSEEQLPLAIEVANNEKVQKIDDPNACSSEEHHPLNKPEKIQDTIKPSEPQPQEKNVPLASIEQAQIQKPSNETTQKQTVAKGESEENKNPEQDHNDKPKSKIFYNCDEQTNVLVDENLVDGVQSSCVKQGEV